MLAGGRMPALTVLRRSCSAALPAIAARQTDLVRLPPCLLLVCHTPPVSLRRILGSVLRMRQQLEPLGQHQAIPMSGYFVAAVLLQFRQCCCVWHLAVPSMNLGVFAPAETCLVKTVVTRPRVRNVRANNTSDILS